LPLIRNRPARSAVTSLATSARRSSKERKASVRRSVERFVSTGMCVIVVESADGLKQAWPQPEWSF
jgi:hypothetical protein